MKMEWETREKGVEMEGEKRAMRKDGLGIEKRSGDELGIERKSGDGLGTGREERKWTGNREDRAEMDWEQRERGGLGKDLKEWRWIWNRERDRGR
jgi:hypothetical protein